MCHAPAGSTLNPNFRLKSGCLCHQTDVRNLTYECSVVGAGNTFWRGSAINCPMRNNEILLRHSLFPTTGTIVECNNGNLSARSLGVENNCYTSQLRVLFSPDLLGRTIVCLYDNLSSEEVVGNATIAITTGNQCLCILALLLCLLYYVNVIYLGREQRVY